MIRKTDIKKLEDDYYQSGSQDVHQKLLLLRTQYNEISATRALSSLLRLKQTFFDQGEKPGRVLAWRIKQLQNERLVTSLQNDNNENIVDPIEIKENFKKFYEKLYRSETDPNTFEMKHFLDSIHIPKISEIIKGELEKAVTFVELSTAIDSMKGGKTPGPDGIPIEVYKMFKHRLMPALLEMFKESFHSGILPTSLRGALITLLPNQITNVRTSGQLVF